MDERIDRALPPLRPEREMRPEATGVIGDVARPLSAFERLTNMTLVRRLAVIVVLAAAWEIYARFLDNPLLFPSLGQTLAAFWDAIAHGVLLDRTFTSLRVLAMGYSIGLVAAGVFTTLAVSTRVGTDFLSTLTAMFNPLPAIALLPLALLWFGLGAMSMVFVIVHSVLWAVALNTHSGFLSVSPTLRMAGQNCGLSGLSYVTRLLVPAAFPSILT
jgi:NitT/TauT family transport system permease protein